MMGGVGSQYVKPTVETGSFTVPMIAVGVVNTLALGNKKPPVGSLVTAGSSTIIPPGASSNT